MSHFLRTGTPFWYAPPTIPIFIICVTRSPNSSVASSEAAYLNGPIGRESSSSPKARAPLACWTCRPFVAEAPAHFQWSARNQENPPSGRLCPDNPGVFTRERRGSYQVAPTGVDPVTFRFQTGGRPASSEVSFTKSALALAGKCRRWAMSGTLAKVSMTVADGCVANWAHVALCGSRKVWMS